MQRDIGWNFVGDVAYVGNAARNQRVDRPINGRPYGYTYQPSSLDPTNVIGGITQPLPDDLLRPYRGYGSITQRDLQRLRRLPLAAVLGEPPPVVGRPDVRRGLHPRARPTRCSAAIDPFVSDNRARNYRWVTGNDGSRKHILNINYSYEVPNLSTKWNNIVVKALADNWQVSGVTSILSGVRQGFSYGYTGGADWRADRPGLHQRRRQPRQHPVRSEPAARRADVRAAVHAPSASGRRPTSSGSATSTNDEYIGPGFMNWDISFFKHVPMGGNRAPAVPGRALQRVQHRSVAADRDRHERGVQLRRPARRPTPRSAA